MSDAAEMSGSMEHRVTALETRLDTVLPTLATKADIGELRADMHELKSEIVKWVVGTALAIAVGAVTVGTFVLNNAIPKSAGQPPIVINVPPSN